MTMRKLFTILVAVLFFATVFAQIPQKMSYQAVIRDANNNLVKNQAVGMKITILQNTTPVYSEIQTPITNANGLVTIEIGGGTGFNAIDWANGSHFIKTEIDPAGGTTYSISSTSQLLSVPFALYAKAITLRVSNTGDTLFLGSGQHIIIPGISAANPSVLSNH